MKRTFLILIISLSSGWLWAQEGVKFEELTFQEALEKAKAENRWIFLDAYTSWCGPCKMMAEKVFTRAEAGDFFNIHFVNVKYDMEKGEGPALAKKLGIGAYPTFVLIKPDGTVHDKLVGGSDVAGIINRVENSMKSEKTVGTLTMRYERGERDKQFLLEYVEALLKVSDIRQVREVAALLTEQLTDTEKVEPACWSLFDNNDLAPFGSANYHFLLENRKQFYQHVGREKVDTRLANLYAGVLSSIVWGRDTKTTPDAVKVMERVIHELRTDRKKQLLAYVAMANAYKKKDTGKLLKLCCKEFPRFSDADVMMMVMPVSVYFRSQEDKEALKEFVEIGKAFIPNLNIQANFDYVSYYFTELEKQL
ncbi:thioredoxin family protein [Butyricimonas sp.]|uniref:thioredoxin family protein n=1 Tax=Butyricimonas sp. TaxID=1969738 RepID=UPI0025C28719|nr:thioredoxin family protein [Butyricimonas sp.]